MMNKYLNVQVFLDVEEQINYISENKIIISLADLKAPE